MVEMLLLVWLRLYLQPRSKLQVGVLGGGLSMGTWRGPNQTPEGWAALRCGTCCGLPLRGGRLLR